MDQPILNITQDSETGRVTIDGFPSDHIVLLSGIVYMYADGEEVQVAATSFSDDLDDAKDLLALVAGKVGALWLTMYKEQMERMGVKVRADIIRQTRV